MNIDCVSIVLCNLDINKYEKVVNVLHYREQMQIAKYWKTHTKYEVKANKYGSKYWYRNGKQHRDGDLPAVEYVDGTKEWWKNGELHRDGDLPAVEWLCGDKEWWKNGKQHRDGDLPAIEFANGDKYWYKNGIKYTPKSLK